MIRAMSQIPPLVHPTARRGSPGRRLAGAALALGVIAVVFVELGLSSALVGFGAHNAEAVAAVLLYPAPTVLPTLALGAVLGFTWPSRSVGLEGGELP
jgi:hypothetical protein